VTDPKEDLAGSQGHAPALPDLPESCDWARIVSHDPGRDLYTADQMRAYAALVLEEAALYVEAANRAPDQWECADIIRSLKP
jgi:hypothetical protein